MRYDVHTHAFHPKIARRVLAQLHDHYGIAPVGSGLMDDLLARTRAAGLDRVVVHTAATTPDQVAPANTWSIELHKRYPEVLAFGTMHPAHPDPEKEFARLERHGIAGLKFHPDFQGFRMDDPAFSRLLERVAGRFTVMFHVGDKAAPKDNPSCPMKLAALLDAFPNLTAIAAHFGGYRHWRWALEHLAGRDVYLDTSSTLAFIDDETLRALWRAHPRERFLFGSDYPLFDPAAEADALARRLGLDEAEVRSLQANAHGLFG
jgi:predicted TIM-barrel fold metal-dependent hydrolase